MRSREKKKATKAAKRSAATAKAAAKVVAEGSAPTVIPIQSHVDLSEPKPVVVSDPADTIATEVQSVVVTDPADPTDPMATMTLEEVVVEMAKTKGEIKTLEEQLALRKVYMQRLITVVATHERKEFGEVIDISGYAEPRQDRRALLNPIKNLKISASRAIGWARNYGENAKAAKGRAIAAVEDAIRKKYDGEFPGGIPKDVMVYIDYLHDNYQLQKKKA